MSVLSCLAERKLHSFVKRERLACGPGIRKGCRVQIGVGSGKDCLDAGSVWRGQRSTQIGPHVRGDGTEADRTYYGRWMRVARGEPLPCERPRPVSSQLNPSL